VNAFEYVRATSLAEVLEQLRGGAVAKAGGVDLLDLMKEQLVSPRRLVGLKAVPELAFVRDEGTLRLGALCTVAELAASPLVRARWPLLADAAAHVATPQVRNMATIGGNLLQRPRCWYFRSADFPCRKKGGVTCFAQLGESQHHAIIDNHLCAMVHPSTLATALVALGASVKAVGPGGERTLLVEQLLTPPAVDVTREHALGRDELLVEVHLPPPAEGTKSAFHKHVAKESFDWPTAEVAAVLELARGRVRRASLVLGAMAPVPHRAREAEAWLAGRALDDTSAREAARAAVRKATPLAKNVYKVQVFEAVIRRALLLAVGGA
jgi:xanthine dehydrogenase YagS FAD-binding subunit